MPRRIYTLRIDRRGQKEMRSYPPKVFKQVATRIFALSVNPRPHDSKKVGVGFRVDVGEYRIIYTVDDEAEEVAVLCFST